MRLTDIRTALLPAVAACALALGATACDVGMEKDSDKAGGTPPASAAPGTTPPGTTSGGTTGGTPTGSGTAAQASPSASATGTPRPPSSAPVTNGAVPQDDLVVSSDSGQPSTDCTGRNARVTGEGVTVTFTGMCRALTIEGDGNSVETAWFDTVTVTGSDNLLLYGVKPDGTKPAITDNGAGNRILKR